MSLKIARGFALPLDVAGEAIAILAKRGAGKTNTGRVLFEELVGAHVQTVVLDPVGAWWGLRASADGKSEGLTVPVLGGAHGDVPLQATAGALLADVVVDTGQSMVLDLSDFSKTEQRRFVTDFSERLYQRKAREKQLLHLILEEADEFAPQRFSAGDARMVGAIEQLVRRGRGRGIGLTMITQRSASLNKSVLEQTDVLMIMRTTGPRDRAAVASWVEKQDVDGADDVLPSLPSLETGEAWVWNPERGVLERVRIRLAHTFDSSQTAKAGQRKRSVSLAAIDLTKLGAEISATAERAKENDPAALRKRLRESELELEKQKIATDTLARRRDDLERAIESKLTEPQRIEVPVLDGNLDRLVDAVDAMKAIAGQLVEAGELVRAGAGEISAAIAHAGEISTTKAPSASDRDGDRAARRLARPASDAERRPLTEAGASRGVAAPAPRSEAVDGDVKLGKGERTVLQVLAEYPEGRTHSELAFLAGYSAKASTLGVILSNLRKTGLVEPGQPIRPTAAGLEAAGGIVERPTGQALLEQWLRHPRIGEGERRVLLALVDAYPEALSHEELCERTGYSPAASTIGVILSKLRKLGLVEKGVRRIAAEFMESIA